MDNTFIGICGIIGAGKTTLTTALSKLFGLPAFYEEVAENRYLEDFYADMKRYSFPLQIYLLNRRFKQHQQIIWQGKGGVQDRTIYEDSIFAKMLMKSGNMEPREFQTYSDLFKNMSNFMCKPNLIVFLDVSPEKSIERIKARGRAMEAGITLEYLKSLHDAYSEFIQDISKVIPVVRVSWDEFRSSEETAKIIKNEYEKMSVVREVVWSDKK